MLLGLLGLVVAEAAAILGRMGKRLAIRLSDMLARRDVANEASGGFLTTLAGILLVLPGFVTGRAGLLPRLPAIQQKLIDSRSARRQAQPERSSNSIPANGAAVPYPGSATAASGAEQAKSCSPPGRVLATRPQRAPRMALMV